MHVIFKILIWLCGMAFIVSFFNSVITPRKDELFRNIREGAKVVGHYRPDYLKGLFGRLDLARFGVGLPQTKEGVFIIFGLLLSVILLTFLVVNYL